MLFDNLTVLVDEIFDDSKYINSDFSSSNFTALRSAYKNTFWTISINNLQFFFAFFDSISIATSSINFNILIFASLCWFFISKNKNQICIKRKMNEIDDFCEISMRIARAACFFSLNANSIFPSIMNDLTHRINSFNIFNLCKITINRFVETWLNASFSSRNKHERTFLKFFAVWISCNRNKNTSITNRFFLSFICSLSNKFKCLTRCDQSDREEKKRNAKSHISHEKKRDFFQFLFSHMRRGIFFSIFHLACEKRRDFFQFLFSYKKNEFLSMKTRQNRTFRVRSKEIFLNFSSLMWKEKLFFFNFSFFMWKEKKFFSISLFLCEKKKRLFSHFSFQRSLWMW